MSELKATRIKMVYDGEIYEDLGTAPYTQLYYRKEEVDKVIAELKETLKNSRNARKYWRKECLFEYKECCYQKYKRCLAMAMRCRRNRLHASVCGPVEKIDFYFRWYKRWLELAEKFKEAK